MKIKYLQIRKIHASIQGSPGGIFRWSVFTYKNRFNKTVLMLQVPFYTILIYKLIN